MIARKMGPHMGTVAPYPWLTSGPERNLACSQTEIWNLKDKLSSPKQETYEV